MRHPAASLKGIRHLNNFGFAAPGAFERLPPNPNHLAMTVAAPCALYSSDSAGAQSLL
jgi:hypothetical protein